MRTHERMGCKMLKSVREMTTTTIVINKSKFIGYLIPVSSEDEAELYLESLKEEYPDATHHCYAYIIDGKQRANDDGEPAKTAGMPILNVLERNELNHVLGVVIRYFGGIKLGAGGLVRAYSQSMVETLSIASIVYKEKAPYYALSFDYHHMRQLDHVLKSNGIEILVKQYDEKVSYECFIRDEAFLESLLDQFNRQIDAQLLRYDDVEIAI